ncbi:hypothetical protein HN51_070003 [Arachis hypogaea]|uniref:Uncharacterized protein n=1 Tax=Arachis hypogaea TaxID=3818 RepID=A0A444Z3N5_ARAHY|nr:uncharacterized protein LOC112750487 [Arachis hypogaea]QHO12340.1 hypothetical protein DS421_15g506120 [Arachis hypogaea]RYR08803.1 hypothetical protein Ahy_B05g076644 isoform B [Arachis hypogaea]
MKERNKGVSAYNNNMDYYYPSTSCEFTCKKHPSSSSVGICALCLEDRLVKLICSDCGEQRLSSCSCSDEIATSHRNSCTVDVGSLGRVSFLIDNDKNQTSPILQNLTTSSSYSNNHNKLHERVVDEATVLRRSSSNSVEIKKSNIGGGGKFWKIGKLFRKNNSKKGKEYYCGRSVGGFDDNNGNGNGNYVNHIAGGGACVSRSRSLCSFRGGALFGSEDGTDSVVPSGARSSISAARSSGVNGGLFLESGRRSGYSEATEPRKSGFDGLFLDSSSEIIDGVMRKGNNGIIDNVVDGGGGGGFYGVNRRVFSLRESDFKGMDESSFIDLKLDYSSESRAELFPPSKMMTSDNFNVNTLPAFGSTRHGGGDGDFVVGDGVSLTSGRGRKSMKGWRWIFRYSNSTNRGSARRRDQQEDLMFNARDKNNIF